MRFGFIGDIVGKPGRVLVKEYLPRLKEEYGLDFVIANGENVSHGFGINRKNAKELLNNGVDLLTGGNHSWDKKEIIEYMDEMPILRPLNYPLGVPGSGIGYLKSEKGTLAVINLMGHYAMPQSQNVFVEILQALENLEPNDGVFIDFHAEATSEKQMLLHLLKGKVSAIVGTHTHVGTDDLQIYQKTGYLTDIGLTGCRDGVLGMAVQSPLKRALTGISYPLEIPKECKGIFQMVVFELEKKECVDAFKIKIYDKDSVFTTKAWHEL